MKTAKTRVVVYHYGQDNAQEAREAADEIRSTGNNVARTIDASNFQDIEETDKVVYVGDFPDKVKSAIRDAYEKIDKRVFTRELSMHSEDGSVAIDIPQNWTEMSFPEMQKLAAALSDNAVRSKEAAISIIETELERREEKLHADLKDSDPAGGPGLPTGRRTNPDSSTADEDEETSEDTDTDENTDGDEDAEDTDAEEGDEDADPEGLDSMTKAQLIEYAEEKEIDLGDASKKADILAAIRDHKE